MMNRIGAKAKKATSGSSTLKGQFDRILEQKILVRNRAGRDGDVQQREQIAEPERAADRRRVIDALADRVKVMSFLGQILD